MIRWRINTLLGELKDSNPSAAEYKAINAGSGVATSTISAIVKGSARVDLDVVGRLLQYFHENLDRPLTTQDLIEFVPDANNKGN